MTTSRYYGEKWKQHVHVLYISPSYEMYSSQFQSVNEICCAAIIGVSYKCLYGFYSGNSVLGKSLAVFLLPLISDNEPFTSDIF